MENQTSKKRSRRKSTQGRKANRSGKLHENIICKTLQVLTKYKTSDPKVALRRKEWNCGVILKNPDFTNVFNCHAHADFFWRPHNNLRVRIECKSQTAAGSVDEKINHVLDNFEHTFCDLDNENVCVLVLEGDHYKTDRGLGIVSFAKKRALEIFSRTGKKVFVTVGQKEFDDLVLNLFEEYDKVLENEAK